MEADSIYLLTGGEVLGLLRGQESTLLKVVGDAYVAHYLGESSLPHSMFLRFPEQPRDRIIALPAYLGGDFELAGIKWIASFPGNLERGIDRASAAMILNSTETGRPLAFLEGSVVSAKRTAASAALAARHLMKAPPEQLVLVGCGLIQFEIARFLRAVWPELATVRLYDLDPARSRQLSEQLSRRLGLECTLAAGLPAALDGADLVSFATTAAAPHVASLAPTREDCVVLHISLRDLEPAVVLEADNIVDDIDHAVRERTSLHLAEQHVGHREFVRCTLAEVLTGAQPPRVADKPRTVFSPFGLGVLDLAVARLALDRAREEGIGRALEDFAPPSWVEWG